MEVKAAIETGLVESGLRNLPGGDADSQGWRQERASLYPNPRNLNASINRFFDETSAVKHKYGNAGELAAAVQRPAAQYRGRYAQVGGQAEALLKQFGFGGGAPAPAPAAGGSPLQGVADAPEQSNGQQLAAVMLSLQAAQPQPRPSVGLAPPAISAAPVMPRGAQQVVSSGGARTESPGAALAQALTAIKGLTGPDMPDEPAAAPAASGGAPAAGGRAEIRPGGSYMGTQGVARSLASIGFDLGLKTTSTKRHNTNPYSGSRSDHDVGNRDAYAYDISNGSAPTKEMDRTAYRIMRELGFKDYEMGQPINTSRGVKTIKTDRGTYRVQVIYRGSGAAFGGNHLNHVHIGVKRVR
jgi:hypothetical protein